MAVASVACIVTGAWRGWQLLWMKVVVYHARTLAQSHQWLVLHRLAYVSWTMPVWRQKWTSYSRLLRNNSRSRVRDSNWLIFVIIQIKMKVLIW